MLSPTAETSTASAAPTWDVKSDTWVATDALDRKVATYEDVSDARPDKFVGMFYFLYYASSLVPGTSTVADVNKILTSNLNNLNTSSQPPWGPGSHNFAEPMWGYYHNEDEYVLKKHAQMLSDAGVDTLIFDLSNFNVGSPENTGYYKSTFLKLMQVFTDVRATGGDTPEVMFLVPWEGQRSKDAVSALYADLYSQNLYSDLWFTWQGKPLIMADPTSITDPAIQSFFTYRKGNAGYGGAWNANEWGWMSNYPQPTYYTDTNANEMMAVSVAQNSSSVSSDPNYIEMSRIDASGNFIARGRSFRNGQQPLSTNPIDPSYPTNEGRNFKEQADRALQLDPDFVFITGWNEWTAGRLVGLPQSPTAGGFTDVFTPEFSRDIEPMKGGYADNYYYQLVDFIREFKGVRKPETISAPQTIAIDGDFTSWSTVSPEFRDDTADKAQRSMPAGGNRPAYSNATGRNEIKMSKVAKDSTNVYFYVETVGNISSATDPNWMRLFLRTNSTDPNWAGYNYVLNRTGVTATTTTLQKSTGGWNWNTVASNIQYKISGNKMEIAIPRAALGLTNTSTPVDIQFKWHDNMQTQGDVSEFYTNGDAAPNSRFNYRYTDTVPTAAPRPLAPPVAHAPSWSKVDDGAPGITYSSGWSASTNSSGSYNNTVHYSNTVGSYVEYAFKGTGIKWLGTKNPDHGKVDVYIDGVLDTPAVDTFGHGVQQQVLYGKTGLTNAQHTIKIVVTGAKHNSSIGLYQDVDSFEIGNPPLVWTSVDDNSPAITYNPAWTASTNASGYLNSTVHYTYNHNDSAEFTFTGSGIRWKGAKNPDHGKADVYIDGVLVAPGVDTYGGGANQQVLYENTALSNAQHTIKIVVTNTKNPAAIGFGQDVDSFEYGVPKVSWKKVDDAYSGLTYGGAWISNPVASGHLNGTLHYTSNANAYAELAFTGTAVRWTGSKNVNHGKADVYIDGVLAQAGIDTYAATDTKQRVLFEKTGLSNGPHTLKVIVTAAKNAASTGYIQDVDSFEYGLTQ
ncbi:hypothetical protein [Microbacterium sp. Se5.02b]|uniref:hypothetical protein n=1 Tax=Microbacterium sp. Se5.02b TaxID=2864103 RepID=UPI001C6939DF|nr:hypothetical protein [Microbacterium sp. Se5.02b]QYM64291.1 hypothetical protein K1X59_20005 [Microbacterium sp. Se5.02b]